MRWTTVLAAVLILGLGCPATTDPYGQRGCNKDAETAETGNPPADTDSDTPVDTDSDTPADTDSDTPADTDSDTVPTAFSLTLTGTGYGVHDGQTVEGVVIDEDQDVPVADDTMVMGADGNLLLEFPNALQAGVNYRLAWYADVNANGSCEVPGEIDHVWSVGFPMVSGDVNHVSDHNGNFDFAGCQYFAE